MHRIAVCSLTMLLALQSPALSNDDLLMDLNVEIDCLAYYMVAEDYYEAAGDVEKAREHDERGREIIRAMVDLARDQFAIDHLDMARMMQTAHDEMREYYEAVLEIEGIDEMLEDGFYCEDVPDLG